MILRNNQTAPEFSVNDVCGNPIRLSEFRGKKVLLTFYRHVGCPVHHLRFMQLSKYDQVFRDAGITVIAIFESSAQNLLKYCQDENFYARLVANPEFDLYQLFDIEVNNMKLLYSMYTGVFAKRTAGQKIARHQFEPEGHRDLLGGEFLIDEEGQIKRVYYNQYLGDHLPVEEILAFVNDPGYAAGIQESPCCEV